MIVFLLAAVLAAAEPAVTPHNYVLFLDEAGRVQQKRPETNGWFLLEALLEKETGQAPSVPEPTLRRFRTRGLYGWWPASVLHRGMRYFPGRKPVRLYPDADDTGWGLRLFGEPVNDETLFPFLSPGSYLLRVWAHPAWHDEIDLVATASLLSAFDRSLSTPLQREVFEANARFLSRLVESGRYARHCAAYKSSLHAAFLLYFHHRTGTPFLSQKAEGVLKEEIARRANDLAAEPIEGPWGPRPETVYGYRLAYVNERIPGLIKRWWDRYAATGTG